MDAGDVFELCEGGRWRRVVESLHDLVTEGHYFFVGFDEEREVIVEIGFLLHLVMKKMTAIHNINLL